MKKCSLIGFTAFLLVLAACNRLRPERSYEVVGDSTAIVQKAFNADSGKVRVLMLVSPTCGVCLRGASDVTEDILKRKGGKNISLYVVWVPRLHALEKNVSPATGVVATSWAKQYWDGQDLLGEQYREVLDWNDSAWDVYMLYGPKARWTGAVPPTPDYFMHQTSERGPRLEASVFGTKVDQLLMETQH
jgi:hypothetical protein